MKTVKEIREDLKDVRYYYSRKEMFEKASRNVGTNDILEKVKTYNMAVCSAPPKLYDVYVGLYTENNTQESLSDKLGFTHQYIQMLNKQFIEYFQEKIKTKEEIA